MSTEMRFTIEDLTHLPDDGNRYEIIDGELYVTTQPHWRHQLTFGKIFLAMDQWSQLTGGGIALPAPGVVFARDQAVAPDVVWISRERFPGIVGADGKLHAAPDLVVEVLSPGRENEERDRELKLKLYSRQGVREYWIVDWTEPAVQVYRRERVALQLVATLLAEDSLASPLLPGFAASVQELCASPI